MAAPLAFAGLIAAVGLARDAGRGRTAVIAVGALSVVAGIAALTTGESNDAVDIVVGGLAVLLGALSAQESRSRLAT